LNITQILAAWWYTYPCEKYELVNGKDDNPYIMENKKCSKAPTSWGYNLQQILFQVMFNIPKMGF
jgi:hypothetical protein